MRKLTLIRAALLISGLGLSSLPAHAQREDGDPAVGIINKVMEYRLNWLRDDTPFDACKVYEQMHRPADFPNTVNPFFRKLLDQPNDPCRRDTTRPAEQLLPRVVEIDSLAVSDTVAHVYLTVRRGEKYHRERYTLQFLTAGKEWGGVRTMMQWGTLQFTPAPRRPDAR